MLAGQPAGKIGGPSPHPHMMGGQSAHPQMGVYQSYPHHSSAAPSPSMRYAHPNMGGASASAGGIYHPPSRSASGAGSHQQQYSGTPVIGGGSAVQSSASLANNSLTPSINSLQMV